MLVFVGLVIVCFYYLVVIKVVSPKLRNRSFVIQNQEKRLRSILTLSFRDRINLFVNGNFNIILNKFEESNKKIRRAEVESILYSNTPRAMLDVAIYMVVILAYYILTFNAKVTDINRISTSELAVILICFQRLSLLQTNYMVL